MATALAGIAIGVAWQYGMVDYQNGFSNLLVLPMLVYVIWLMRHMMVEEKRLSVENQLLGPKSLKGNLPEGKPS